MRAPRAVDLEVALLAERRARGRDGQRMRFAASSSVDLGQHAGAAFASDGGRRCEVRRRAARPVDRREQRSTSFLRCATTVGTDEPVSGVRIDASPGMPDFFDASAAAQPRASSSSS